MAYRCAMFHASISTTRFSNTSWHVRYLLHNEALQLGIEGGSRSTAVCVRGLQYCQYSQEKISLISLLSHHVCRISTSDSAHRFLRNSVWIICH
jgi:hypothetical protein